MKTGAIVKLLRTTEGISQTELASELGIARTYLSQIENCKVEPGMPFLRLISKRFELPLVLLVIDQNKTDHEIIPLLQEMLVKLLTARALAQKS